MQYAAFLFVINFRIIKIIAFLSETVLGDRSEEHYSKVLRINVRYRDVVTLTETLSYPSFYSIY